VSAARVRHPGEFRWETRLLGVVTLVLTALGIAACYSSSTYLQSWQQQASQQLPAALVGGVVFLIASHLDYDLWRRLARPMLYLTVAGLVLLAVPAVLFRKAGSGPAFVEHFFPSFNGARRWIRVGIQVQVSEIARFTLVVWAAARSAELAQRVRDFRQGFVPLVGTVGLVAALTAMEPSVTMAVVLAVTGVAVIFTAGARIWHFVLPLIPATGVLAAILVFSPVRAKRLTEFRSTSVECTSGQVCESLIGFGNGGVLGVGFGRGTQKLGNLPEGYSDFLLSVIGEEWGLLGVTFVALCFGLFCWIGFRIAKTARDPFGTYLAAGLTVAVGVTAFLHAAVVTSMMIPTGLTLPFMSAGRVSLILSLLSAGVLVSIGRRRGRPAREQ
jgi:cell division protein FtsW